jgi:hypothetical protein
MDGWPLLPFLLADQALDLISCCIIVAQQAVYAWLRRLLHALQLTPLLMPAGMQP